MRWSATALAVFVVAACGREVKRGVAVTVDTAAQATLPTSRIDTAAPDTSIQPQHQEHPAGSPPAEPEPPIFIAITDSAAGDALFHGKGRCFTCHGQRGEGTARLGPALTDTTTLTSSASLDVIRTVIANGVAVPKAASVAMPAYSGMLSEQEIARVAAYVYALAHPGRVVPDSAPSATLGDSTTREPPNLSRDSMRAHLPSP
jgi:mono/diheme cytochrome c family protein